MSTYREPVTCREGLRQAALRDAALSSCEKPFIFFVGAYPEPEDLIRRFPNAHRAVITADTDRNQPVRSMNLLEVQTWMTRVLHELPIS